MMDKSPSDPHQIPDGSSPVPKEKSDDYGFSQTLDDQYNKAFAQDIAPTENQSSKEPVVNDAIAGSSIQPQESQPSSPLHQPSYPEGREESITQPRMSSQLKVEKTQEQNRNKEISNEYQKVKDSAEKPLESQPQIIPEQGKIQETYPNQVQKKKGGCCNVTTCCMGSCGAFLLLVSIIAALLLLAPNTVSETLNRILSPDVSVPVREEVDLDFIEQKLDKITGDFGTESIVLSEDEFNALAYKRLYETNTENMKTELRADFSSDTSEAYIRLYEWMPWITLTLHEDEKGIISGDKLHLGAWDLSKFSERILSERLREKIGFISSSGDVDMYYFFNKILFEDKKGLEISTVDISQDEVTFEIIPITEEQDSGRENPF